MPTAPRDLLAACLAQVRATGITSFTLGGLAQSVQMSKSGLYAYFKSKEQLQLALIDEARRQFYENVVQPALLAPRGEPRIRVIWERWIAWGKVEGGCAFLAWGPELDDRPGPAREALRASESDWMDLLSGAARIAIDEGHFDASLDVHQWAYEFYALCTGHQHFARLMEDPRADQHMTTAVEALLLRCRAQPRGEGGDPSS